MEQPWPTDGEGVVTLPSGRRVRGRGLRGGDPLLCGLAPQFGLYLLGRTPPSTTWERCWVDWPDFRLPRNPAAARTAFEQALERSARQRVEVACAGGTGRTGTTLACLAVLDGVPAADAVAWIRTHYRPRAVETPGQRRFVQRFGH